MGRAVRRTTLAALMALVALVYAAPLAWIAVTAVSPARATDAGADVAPPTLASVPRRARENFGRVMASPVVDFHQCLRNSLIVAALSVAGMVVSSSVAAYGFSRVRWRGRDAVFLLVLATMMIPFAVVMAPQYLLFKHLGWIGTLRPLWLPAWFGGAFSVFLLRQFFMEIPRELDEAARLDGCSHLGVFRLIILPLARPALVVVALIQFMAAWNDFLGPLVFINHDSKYTLALGLHMFQAQHGGTPWNLVMMATLLVILPVLVVFVLAQDAIIEGVASQALRD